MAGLVRAIQAVRPARTADCGAEGRDASPPLRYRRGASAIRGSHLVEQSTPHQRKQALQRRAEGATLKELAQSYNLGDQTISRLGT